MSMDTITLTRAQWNAIWDEAKQAANSASDLCGLRDAFVDLGLSKAVERIERSQREIGECRRNIARILVDAEEAMAGDPQALAIDSKSNPNKEA
ncbi:hypothetical protein [Methylobacterium fujisawaense]|uniref:hypothetical protein n=1 Tax=Methylobacterium fujisawaense TaxID=107400 RepID=UPI00313AF3BF